MSPAQILGLFVSFIQQMGLVPYIQAAALISFAIGAIALVRRAFSNS